MTAVFWSCILHAAGAAAAVELAERAERHGADITSLLWAAVAIINILELMRMATSEVMQ